MKKFEFLILFLLIGAVAYANPFAAHLAKDGDLDISTGPDTVEMSFYLNEQADTTVTIKTDPGGAVAKIIDLGTLDAGYHSVIWDGSDEANQAVGPGDVKFEVTCDSAGYGDWTNITPSGWYASEVWSVTVGEFGGDASGNGIRGIAFDGTDKVVVSRTHPSDAVGFLYDATGGIDAYGSLTIGDPYDADIDSNTTETWSLSGWLGPYDLASNDDNVFLASYLGASFPIAEVVYSSTHAAVVIGGANSRVIDAVGSGAGALIYMGNATPGNPITVFSATGSIFQVSETITAVCTHTLAAKEDNTGGDGDVVWSSGNADYTHKYVRSGGTWSEDATFLAAQVPWALSGRAFQIGGQDYLALVINAGDDRVEIYNGDTGALEAVLFDASAYTGIAKVYSGNACIDVVMTGSSKGVIYVGFAQNHTIAKFNFHFGEVGSAQYYSPEGLEIVNDQTSDNFGNILISNSWPAASSNGGAVADQQGCYVLRNDLSFMGDSAAAAYAAAGNNGSPNWLPGDNWSPWMTGEDRDEEIFYLGDWGLYLQSDDLWRYEYGTTASAILAASATLGATPENHGRVIVAEAYGTGSSKILVGADRDYGGIGYPSVTYWNVGTATSMFSGTQELLILAPTDPVVGGALYSFRDLIIESSGGKDLLYLVNRRWSDAQLHFICCELDIGGATPVTVLWAKTAADVGLPSGNYPHGLAADLSKGLLYVCASGTDVIYQFDPDTGDLLATIDPTTENWNYGGFDIDDAGNLYTSNSTSEHVRMWSPPGASTYTTVFNDVITVTAVGVDDWMVY